MKQYGDIYEAAKIDPAGAAQLYNQVKSNGVTDAARAVFVKNPHDGKTYLEMQDAQGNPVQTRYGPAKWDAAQLDAKFNPGMKGRFKMGANGVLFDTTSGAVAGQFGDPKLKLAQRKFSLSLDKAAISVLSRRFGGTFQGGVWMPDPKNAQAAINAEALAEYYLNTDPTMKDKPAQAAEKATADVQRGVKPPREWMIKHHPSVVVGQVVTPDHYTVNDGTGERAPTQTEKKQFGLPNPTPGGLMDTSTKKGKQVAEQAAIDAKKAGDPESYFKALKALNPNADTATLENHVKTQLNLPDWQAPTVPNEGAAATIPAPASGLPAGTSVQNANFALAKRAAARAVNAVRTAFAEKGTQGIKSLDDMTLRSALLDATSLDQKVVQAVKQELASRTSVTQ